MTSAVVLYGLDIDPDVGHGVTVFGSQLLDLVDESRDPGWLGDEEQALTATLGALLPVGGLLRPRLAKHG